MKKRGLIGFLGAAIFCMFAFSNTSVNGSGSVVTPGSESDPLVSKSYVDNKFNQLNQLIASMGIGAGESGNNNSNNGSIGFEPVFASAGQIVVGGEGAEIILRSGKAVGYITGTDGLVDATTGIEVFNGFEINKNHLVLVPRSDGRGAKVTEDAWFIVKGSYSIIN